MFINHQLEIKMNFLKETVEAITESKHTSDEIIFIGSEITGHSCNWQEFTEMADFEYDDGFNIQVIPHDLLIVFSDGSKLVRHEYDGSEWWEHRAQFVMPKIKKQIHNLKALDEKWVNLAKINE